MKCFIFAVNSLHTFVYFTADNKLIFVLVTPEAKYNFHRENTNLIILFDRQE